MFPRTAPLLHWSLVVAKGTRCLSFSQALALALSESNPVSHAVRTEAETAQPRLRELRSVWSAVK